MNSDEEMRDSDKSKPIQKNDFYKNLIETSKQGVVVVQDYKLIYANRGFLNIFGYTLNDLRTSSIDKLKSLVHPDDIAKILKYHTSHLQGKSRPSRYECRIFDKNKNMKWIEAISQVIQFQNKPAAQVIVIDITAQKTIESKLLNTQQDWEHIFHSIDDPILILNSNFKIISANQTAHKAACSPDDELIGKKCYEVFHNKKKIPAGCPMEKLLNSGHSEKVDMEIELLNGTYRITCIPIYNHSGQLDKVIHIATDITDQKKTEQALKESERFFRSLYENASIGLYRTTPDGEIILANPTLVKILGYKSLEDLKKRNLEKEGFEPSYSRKEFIKNIKKNGAIRGLEAIWQRKDKSLVYIRENARAIYDKNKKILYYEGTVEDITDQKQIKEALRERDATLHSIFRASPTGIGLTSDRVLLQINDKICEMTGYSREELLGKGARMLYPSKKEYDKVGQKKYDLIRIHGTGSVETRWKRKDGRIIDILLSSSPLDVDNFSKGIIFTALDITKRKIAENQIKNDLKIKEILLHEIHHRVKNNFQIIISLLNLQTSKTKSKKLKSIVAVSKNRIRSMALVHEKLYRSKDFSKIDFKKYTASMVSELFSVYTVGNRISLALNISNIKLGLDKAIPCGLLLNEMITNALKHAFPDNRKGTIQIDFHKTKKNNYELTVKDNGVGLPVQVDIKNTRTLGLQLIHILTDQINGHLTVENKKGTSFKVRFENAA